MKQQVYEKLRDIFIYSELVKYISPDDRKFSSNERERGREKRKQHCTLIKCLR